jgi:hypothetical protein
MLLLRGHGSPPAAFSVEDRTCNRSYDPIRGASAVAFPFMGRAPSGHEEKAYQESIESGRVEFALAP